MCLHRNLEKTCKTFISFHSTVPFTSKHQEQHLESDKTLLGGTFSEEFGTVVAQGEVVGPLCVPAFAWGGGPAALAAHTLGADLERKERNAVGFLILGISSDLKRPQMFRVDFSTGMAFSAKITVTPTPASKDIPILSHPSPQLHDPL